MDPSASDVARDITRLLAPNDPATAAAHVTRILWFLADKANAEGASVLVPNTGTGDPVQIATYKLQLERLAAIRTQWAEAESWLLKGQFVVTPAHVFCPIIDREQSGAVLAVLYLDAPRTFDAGTMQPYLDGLGESLALSRQVVFEGGGTGAPRPTGRVGFMKVLADAEWNLARAARVLGVSRRTVYLRMQRYGIERQRIPKSVTKLRHAR
jgi:regulatory Fis family protein